MMSLFNVDIFDYEIYFFFLTDALGGLCLAIGLILSPLTVGVCKRKSTRLTGVIGGLVLALGCLFSSFANQFHQLFFSHAIMTGKKVLTNISWKRHLEMSGLYK